MRVDLIAAWGPHLAGETIECDEARARALLSADMARPVGEAPEIQDEPPCETADKTPW